MTLRLVTSTAESQPRSTRPRVLTGREIERLCRNDPAAAARLAIDLATERVTFKRPTSEQALLLTGATVQGYCHANQLMRASAKSR